MRKPFQWCLLAAMLILTSALPCRANVIQDITFDSMPYNWTLSYSNYSYIHESGNSFGTASVTSGRLVTTDANTIGLFYRDIDLTGKPDFSINYTGTLPQHDWFGDSFRVYLETNTGKAYYAQFKTGDFESYDYGKMSGTLYMTHSLDGATNTSSQSWNLFSGLSNLDYLYTFTDSLFTMSVYSSGSLLASLTTAVAGFSLDQVSAVGIELTSGEVYMGGGDVWIDNLVLSTTATPLPGSLLLLGTGLAGLLCLRRKREA